MTKYQGRSKFKIDSWAFLKSLFNNHSDYHGPETGPSPNGSATTQETQTRYTLINQLLNQVGDFEASPFYKYGLEDGKSQGDFNDAIETIENTFDALIHSSDELKLLLNSESRFSQRRAAQLQKEVEYLEQALDENNPESQINKLNREIKRLKDKIETHYANRFQDDFVETHNDILNMRYEAEKDYILKLEENRDQLHQDMKESINKMTARMKGAIDDFSMEASQKNESQLQGQNQRVDQFAALCEKTIRQFGELNTLAISQLKASMKESVYKYKDLAGTIKMDGILVPSRFKILGTFLLFCIILIGEIYLVFKVTSETLGMDPASDDGLYAPFPGFFVRALVVFCVAYPIAIGMATKNYIVHARNRHLAIRNINTFIGVFVVLTVLSIALLIPTVPGAIIPNFDQEPFTLPVYLRQALYSLAFFGITTMFSAIAGLLYVDFTEAYERFVNIRKEPLIRIPFWHQKKDRYDPVQMINVRIQEKEDEIGQLRSNLTHLQKELAYIETMGEFNLEDWNLAETLESLKKASVGAYRFGYQRGMYEVLKLRFSKPESFVNLFRNKKLLNYYLSLFKKN